MTRSHCAGEDFLLGLGPGLFHHADVFRIGFSAADLHKAAAHLLHDEVVAEGLHRIEFTVVPGAFEELQHEHAHAVADGAQGGTHGGGSLALARAGIHDDQSSTHIWHEELLDTRTAISSRLGLNDAWALTI